MSTSSYVAWRGPSVLDGAPVMAIAVPQSTNRKTGPMTQVHIVREDLHPLEALTTGADASICGACPLRGDLGRGRACYVRVAQGPASAWKASTSRPTLEHGEVRARMRGQKVRLGAYGDPVALPLPIVSSWLERAAGWTGYTHQWRTTDQAWRHLLMASVESVEAADDAWDAGWRTFRVGGDPISRREIVCPHTTRGVSCLDCGLCDGARPGPVASIVIAAHGAGKRLVHG